jgi:hypothetical protein
VARQRVEPQDPLVAIEVERRRCPDAMELREVPEHPLDAGPGHVDVVGEGGHAVVIATAFDGSGTAA